MREFLILALLLVGSVVSGLFSLYCMTPKEDYGKPHDNPNEGNPYAEF